MILKFFLNMSNYEIPFAVSTEIPIQGIESLKTRLIDTLEKHGGKIISCEYWGIRSLAYKINKHSKGRFFILKVTSEPGFPIEITKYLRINETVLRYAIYKEEELDTKPSPILTSLLKTPEYLSTEEEKAFANIFTTQA
jgi:small subunit ribosomal protein S6